MNSSSFKVVLAGDLNVGKTSLIYRFVDDFFAEDYLPTLGFQIFVKNLRLDNISIDFTIWDVGGGQNFQLLRKNYYVRSDGFLLVFDLGAPESFNNLDKWLAELREVCPKAPFVLVGNKNDIPDKKIPLAEINEKSNSLGASGTIITSAKTGFNVKDAFNILGRAIIAILPTLEK
ncbi:MAG: small GTP-binding protein [Promethearchaeota archaeon CR_4]|nr:MAG: small GTP-binding protein [Candidatus Lokiarchaeota archaeon CR_4]